MAAFAAAAVVKAVTTGFSALALHIQQQQKRAAVHLYVQHVTVFEPCM
jgi:hypothetical protein